MRNLFAISVVILSVSAGCGGRQIPSDAFADVAGDVIVDVPSADAADVVVADFPGTDLSGRDALDDVPRSDLQEVTYDDGAVDTVVQDATVDGLSDAIDDASAAQCTPILPAVAVGLLEQTPLDEVSGLVASRQHPGVLWGHNDSGDEPVIYAIQLPSGPAGEPAPLTVVKFTVNQTMAGWPEPVPEWKSTAVDWEDIAIGPFAGIEDDAIFIADTGDNSFEDPEKQRKSVRVYVLPEPTEIVAGDIADVKWFDITYDDGYHDSEAFFVDPWTGDMYLVEKQHHGSTAGVYRVPAAALSGDRAGAPLVAQKIATIDVAVATGADISADGLMLAIRNYGGADGSVATANNGLVWNRTVGMTVQDMLAGPGCPLPNFPAEPWLEVQGESIAINQDKSGFYTVSEEFFLNPNQIMHFWEFDR